MSTELCRSFILEGSAEPTTLIAVMEGKTVLSLYKLLAVGAKGIS